MGTHRCAPWRAIFSAITSLTLLLTACGDQGGTDAMTATISGALQIAASEGASTPPALDLPPIDAPAADGMLSAAEREQASRQRAILDDLDDPRLRFVPGEVIVAFEPGVPAATASTLQAEGVTMQVVRNLPMAGARLLRANVDANATRNLIRALAARPDVRYAEPNLLLTTQLVPNDALWTSNRSYFWHYDQIGLPDAWDLTTGSADTVIAVIDTGILYDLADTSPTVSHPDFAGKILPGYDMIANVDTALDGDGRDDDPYDDGDLPLGMGQPSYHGTHVAGTIAAASNDAVGMPGVDWNAMILPVRTLGYEGGTLADVIDGIYWAAGLAGPANPNPAHVLNLSLGAWGTCGSSLQAAFDAATAAGAVSVVAAGNENDDVANYTPASCRNVIVVGATDYAGSRAVYSNYGARLDVMAPGGDVYANLNGDQLEDGVLSALAERDDVGALTMTHAAYEGTSMAAPHVAGLVGLMRALDTDLTPAEIEAILKNTADPLTMAQCNRFLASDCGAGLIDAPAALQAVLDGSGPEPENDLTFTPSTLDFGSDLTTLSVTVQNDGTEDVAWTVTVEDDPSNPVPLEGDWVTLPTSGTVPAGSSDTLDVSVDRDAIDGYGAFAAELVFEEDDTGTTLGRLPVLVINPEPDVGPTGPTAVTAFRFVGGPDPWLPSGSTFHASFPPNYVLTVTPGITYVAAIVDENANDVYDLGDFLGFSSDFLTVAGGSYPGTDVTLERAVTGPTDLLGMPIDAAVHHPALYDWMWERMRESRPLPNLP